MRPHLYMVCNDLNALIIFDDSAGKKPAARSKAQRYPLKYVGWRDGPIPNRPQVGNRCPLVANLPHKIVAAREEGDG